jgi:hypothetical protein
MNYHSATDQRSGSACFPLGSLPFLPLGTKAIMRLPRAGVKRKNDFSAMNIHPIFNYLGGVKGGSLVDKTIWLRRVRK